MRENSLVSQICLRSQHALLTVGQLMERHVCINRLDSQCQIYVIFYNGNLCNHYKWVYSDNILAV